MSKNFKLSVPKSTRTCWQIRVGRKHLVEILFCVRQKDFAWMRKNFDTIQSELQDMLEDSILPRVFGKTVEEHYRSEEAHEFPPQIGQASASTKKRRRSKTKPPPPPPAEKPPKDVYYAFGDLIQVAFRPERARKMKLDNKLSGGQKINQFSNHGGDVTLFFTKQQANEEEQPQEEGKEEAFASEKSGVKEQQQSSSSSRASFVQYHHFPERIVLWCQPNQDVIDTTIGGFHRPEYLPLASLFHESVRTNVAAAEDEDE
jgi:hypothetical protein